MQAPGRTMGLRQAPPLSRMPAIAHRARIHSTVRAAAQTVPVTVSVKRQVSFGETIKLVGNQPFLGDWDPHRAASLKWKDGHIWETTLDVPVGVDVNFKVIQMHENGSNVWETGDDRKFKALGPHYALQITCRWDDTNGTQIKAVPLKGAPESDKGGKEQDKPRQDNNNSNGVKPHKSQDQGDRQPVLSASHGNGNGRSSESSPSASTALSSLEEDARSTSAWVGAKPEFVRQRPDKGNRDGVWRTDGLHGAEYELVKGDQGADNWLSKLGLMKSLLVDRPHMMRPHMEELVACYVYGTWINTGAIQCVETGGHHRPNHHANAALQMFRSLEWAIGDAANGDGGMHWPAEARILAARRMHTRLPSISDEFRVSVPLTRIRDIAHRNDIPKELKDEIKHTLQNKLHRSAGPEDLVATEAMLARVTAKPGQYSAAFVEEFKIFAVELREFFNASGLKELLAKTYASLDDEHKAIVNQFQAAMAKLETDNPSMQDLMSALLSGTQARCLYVRGLSAGLRNDVGDNVLAMRQRWRLAEIRIEDYVFVLLARIIGELEKAGGANMMAKSSVVLAWRAAVDALINGLRHLGLSGYATKELLMLENELQSWMNAYTSGDAYMRNENALRGKACAERIQRLSSQYSDLVVSIYSEPAKRLGDALGVESHMSRIFAESEVRASVAFQVSRLVGLLNKTLRAVAEMDAWDGLVTGTTYGRLVEVEGISPEVMDKACAGHSDKVILLARRASGDEEVGSLGPRLAGVILCQELPHLSHLGVRARQEKCVFATCDDEEHVASKVRPLVGKHIKMSVTTDGVSLLESAAPAPAPSRAAAPAAPAAPSRASSPDSRSVSPPPRPSFSPRNRYKPAGATASRSPTPSASTTSTTTTTKCSRLALVPLSQATVDTCGSKAAKCGELESLAAGVGCNMFTTPPGTVLPFGSMELVLQDSGKQQKFQEVLTQLEQPSLAGVALDDACDRMASLLHSLRLPASLLAQITARFGSGKLLAVRSSANVEDLAGMSAAGLYESKVGVPSDDSDALNAAIVEVWASLYTRRAVLSRRAAGVGQLDACMSVLIMELAAPEVSFVLHTARPVDNNTNVILAELAPGQGETLASGTRGTPWRLEIEKSTNKVETLAFANFSRALVVPGMPAVPGLGSPNMFKSIKYASFDEQHGGSGGGGGGGGAQLASRTGLVEVEVDYSQQRLSTDNAYREQVARHLARVGMLIESQYNKQPQDIEGGLVSAGPGAEQLKVMVFQTRPQH